MESSKELLIIKDIAEQLLPGCKVLLFGSRAREEANTNSDYDVILINPVNIEMQKKMQYKAMFRKMAVKFGLMTDVFIESEEEIKEKSAFMGHIVRTALKEGVYI
ncbi:MAG: nucleotidyltransferase domain-containing protein [Bacteroidota bacterium]